MKTIGTFNILSPPNRLPGSSNKFSKIIIRGDGVAACCCAHLMATAGLSVVTDRSHRALLPALLLGARTQALIADVFGRADIFSGLPRIDKRIVTWGRDSKAVAIPHDAVLISEEELVRRLRPSDFVEGQDPDSESNWNILAARPLPGAAVVHRFGSRTAAAVPVKMASGFDSSACWIESLECGWLFLIPGANSSGWLLAVGGPQDLMLGESRTVSSLIAGVLGDAIRFAAYPGIADPLCGPGWLACGSAAMTFDPLCGDGIGNSIREAILTADGANDADVLEHYEARLIAGVGRHLEICRPFYDAGNSGPWWRTESELLLQGIDWCGRQRSTAKPFRYRLNGFQLQPIKI